MTAARSGRVLVALLCLAGATALAAPPPTPPAKPLTPQAAAAPAPTAAAAPAPTAAAVPAPTAKVAAGGILGRNVVGPDGHVIGRVVDVLVDAGSNPRAAVIDFGGFMGVGSRQVAVNWSDLSFPPVSQAGTDLDIKLDLTADQIKAAPPYTDQTKPATVVEPPPAKSPLAKPDAAPGQ